MARNLAAKLAADRSSCAGDQDHATAQTPPDERCVLTHGPPAQQILKTNVTDLVDQYFVLHQLRQRRNALRRHTGPAALFENRRNLPSRHIGESDQDLVHAVFPRNLLKAATTT